MKKSTTKIRQQTATANGVRADRFKTTAATATKIRGAATSAAAEYKSVERSSGTKNEHLKEAVDNARSVLSRTIEPPATRSEFSMKTWRKRFKAAGPDEQAAMKRELMKSTLDTIRERTK